MAIPKEVRVIQLIDSLEPGGAERMAVTIANGLADEVAFSGLVVTRLEGGLQPTIDSKVGYLFLNKKRAIDFGALFRLKSFVDKHQVKIIHAHGSSYFFAVLLKLVVPSLQIFWHDHFGNRANSSKRYRLLRLLSIFFAGVLVVNKSLQKWAQEQLSVKEVRFIPNFTSITAIEQPVTFLKGEVYKRIVFLANLHHPKNHLMALRAFFNSQIANEGWTLHLIGKDKQDAYSAELRCFIAENELQEAVFIYGSCNDVNSILKQANVGILVSSYEGFPVTLLEYGNAALTVICSDVGYCNTIIQDGITGHLIPPNEEQLLEQALIKVSKESQKNEMLAKNLNTFVQTNYAAKKIIQDIQEFYAKSI